VAAHLRLPADQPRRSPKSRPGPARPRITRNDSALRPDHRPNRPPTLGSRHQVNIKGERVTLDPEEPLAQAQWAKTRYSIAIQTLPNGYCGLPLRQRVLHLYAEFRNETNGHPQPEGRGLLPAPSHHGLTSITKDEKNKPGA
jgi:hypothetical protein